MDHDPKPATMYDPKTGASYQVGVEGKPHLSDPVLLNGDPSSGKVSMMFTSEAQVQEWLRKQRDKGLDVQPVRRAKCQGLRVHPLEAEWTFGGEEAVREIARISLNFLAHHFPDLARQPGLRAVKDFIQGRGGSGFVDYDIPAGHRGLEAPSSPFGHRVLIVVDAHQGRVAGRLSLFSRYHFRVLFGAITSSESHTLTTDIDPLADRAPEDLIVRRHGTVPDLSTATGASPEQVKAQTRDLLAAIEDRTWERFAADLMERLAPARALAGDDREQSVADALTEARQVLLNILTHVIRQGAAHLRKAGMDAEALEVWTDLAATSDDPTGVTPVTHALIELLRWRFARHIAEHLDEIGDEATLRQVLCGPVATRLAAEVLHEIWNRASSEAFS